MSDADFGGARRLRILLISPSLPYPPIWGFGIRVNQFLRLLGQRHDVSLLTYEEPGEADKVAGVKALGVNVHTIRRPATSEAAKRWGQMQSLFSPTSYQRRSLYSIEMQRALDELAAAAPYDVIQLESSQLGGFSFDPRSVVVLDEHNIEYELLQRMCETEGALLRRTYNFVEYRKFKREETRSWRTVDGCVMTSAREETIARAHAPGTPMMVGANAVDVDYFRADGDGRPESMVMTGLMHYRPNIDGAVYFINEILPRILALRPAAVFKVVGAGPTDELKRLAGPHVDVTGTVPDVRPYVHDAGVFVVPLRMGGGTRLKVLEGLAMQKAVVSTAVGCEGIDVVDGQHLLVADAPEAFAAAVLRMMDDRDAAARLGRQGRALVEERYQWRSVVDRLEGFYGQLLARRGSPATAQAVAGRRAL